MSEDTNLQSFVVFSFGREGDDRLFPVYIGKQNWNNRPKIGEKVRIIAVDGSGEKRVGVVVDEIGKQKVYSIDDLKGWEHRKDTIGNIYEVIVRLE